MHNLVTVNICGFPNILDTWELIHWITAKTLTGSKLTASAFYHNTYLKGQLLPHSIDGTQFELTRSLLVDLITPQGTYTFNCKHLTDIELD